MGWEEQLREFNREHSFKGVKIPENPILKLEEEKKELIKWLLAAEEILNKIPNQKGSYKFLTELNAITKKYVK